MKPVVLILTFFVVIGTLQAQYRKLPLDGTHCWREWHKGPYMPLPGTDLTCCFVLRVAGDFTDNGKVYKLIYGSDFQCDILGASVNESNYIREDTIKKIVVVWGGGNERILYNFSKNVNDTAIMMNAQGSLSTYTLMSKDSVQMADGLYYRRFNYSGNYSIIEGIGSLRGLLKPWPNIFENTFYLLEFYKESPIKQTIYQYNRACPVPSTIGIKEMALDEIGLFPNPVTNQLTLLSTNGEIDRIEIITTLGESVKFHADNKSDRLLINTTAFAPGAYYIIIYKQGVAMVKYFIKTDSEK
jgi:hypothetical protein